MVIVIVIGALPACNLAIWQSGNCNCNCNLQRVPNSGNSHNSTTTCCQAVNNSLGVAQVVVVAVAVLACNRLIIYGMLPCGSNNNFSFDWSTWPNAALKILGRIYSAHQAAWDTRTDRLIGHRLYINHNLCNHLQRSRNGMLHAAAAAAVINCQRWPRA